MSLFGITDTTPCANCGHEFAEHDYVAESIDQYKCPVPHVEQGYGFFCGGDPRLFFPDYEECTPEEIANWKRACDQADEVEAARRLACPSGPIFDDQGEWAGHITRAPFGIGCYTVEFEQFFEARESDGEEIEDTE